MSAEEVAPCKICGSAIGNTNGLCESCHGICLQWCRWVKSPQDETHTLSFWKYPFPPFFLVPAVLVLILCTIAYCFVFLYLYPKSGYSLYGKIVLAALFFFVIVPVSKGTYAALNPLEQRRCLAFYVSLLAMGPLGLMVYAIINFVRDGRPSPLSDLLILAVLLAVVALSITMFLDKTRFRREARLAIQHVMSSGETLPMTGADEVP